METIFNCSAQPIDKNTSGEEMTQLYKQALTEGKSSGFTPVVVFVDDILEETVEDYYSEAESSEAYISSVLSKDHPDGKKYLDKCYEALEEFYGEELSLNEELLDALRSQSAYASDSKVIPSAGTFEGNVYLLRVPSAAPYEVFAYIPFCGWNDCPGVDDMISVCRHWYDSYGALPAVITHDMLIFYLEDPVTDVNTVAELAKEHAAFCQDSLDMGGIESCAAMINKSPVWSFWWD